MTMPWQRSRCSCAATTDARISLRAEELVAGLCSRSNRSRNAHLSCLWTSSIRNDAHGLLPVFLRMCWMQNSVEAEGRRLLRVLFLRGHAMPVDTRSTGERPDGVRLLIKRSLIVKAALPLSAQRCSFCCPGTPRLGFCDVIACFNYFGFCTIASGRQGRCDRIASQEAVETRFLNDDCRKGFSGPLRRLPLEPGKARQQRRNVPGSHGMLRHLPEWSQRCDQPDGAAGVPKRQNWRQDTDMVGASGRSDTLGKVARLLSDWSQPHSARAMVATGRPRKSIQREVEKVHALTGPIDMARDHNAGGQSELHAVWMGELLRGNRQQGVSASSLTRAMRLCRWLRVRRRRGRELSTPHLYGHFGLLRLSVGLGATRRGRRREVLSESRMRESRLSGSMSCVWKRSQWSEPRAPPDERGGKPICSDLQPPRHTSTLRSPDGWSRRRLPFAISVDPDFRLLPYQDSRMKR